jgi:hypothetical protein
MTITPLPEDLLLATMTGKPLSPIHLSFLPLRPSATSRAAQTTQLNEKQSGARYGVDRTH